MSSPRAWVIHDPDYSVPIPVVLHVHDDVAALHEWYRERGREADQGGWDWEAITSTRLDDDADPELGDCFEVHIPRTRLWMSVIAHEATHVGLFIYAHRHLHEGGGARAWSHIYNHTEELPETIGNLTAHLVHLLSAEYPESFGKDGDQ